MKKIVVCGAGGFIGGHLTKILLSKGNQVRAVDIKPLTRWYQVFLPIWEEWDLLRRIKQRVCSAFSSIPIY
jgi:nucleoside-diphosphate-sugar epimerase